MSSDHIKAGELPQRTVQKEGFLGQLNDWFVVKAATVLRISSALNKCFASQAAHI